MGWKVRKKEGGQVGREKCTNNNRRPKNATIVLIAISTENQNPSKRKLYSERKQKLGDKNYLDQTLDIK